MHEIEDFKRLMDQIWVHSWTSNFVLYFWFDIFMLMRKGIFNDFGWEVYKKCQICKLAEVEFLMSNSCCLKALIWASWHEILSNGKIRMTFGVLREMKFDNYGFAVILDFDNICGKGIFIINLISLLHLPLVMVHDRFVFYIFRSQSTVSLISF